MPLTKSYDPTGTHCKVTFSLPADDAQNTNKLFLAGDFNGWNPTVLPMHKAKGVFSVSVELEADKQHQYRYVTEAGAWLNDTQADLYVYNPFADADNSVVAL